MAKEAQSTIFLRLRELAQLFNSMDPSPFVERDLDADAEEFILSWARELPGRDHLELVLHLTSVPPPDRAAGVQEAVRHYFATRAEIKRRDLGFLMRRGRLSLMVGLVFLVVCLGLSQFIGRHFDETGVNIVREGLVIAGWVAMWRPLEICLYDWWPLWDDLRILSRLARMKVRLDLPADAAFVRPEPLAEEAAATGSSSRYSSSTVRPPASLTRPGRRWLQPRHAR
jgi:hypothetical protein